MADLVYRQVITLAKTAFRVMDMRITVDGAEHIPREGGAVIACNHISYVDFILCGYGAQPAGRLVRFMAKEEIFANRVGGPLMRAMKHISVDRSAGLGSYRAALAALKAGEVVGIFPEATVGRSFTLQSLKSGATRMAAAADVPVIPMALWGTQRLWTKGRKRQLFQRHLPISILIGEPLHPTRRDKQDEVNAELAVRMTALLDRAQREYPVPAAQAAGAWWQPAHLGGSAPLPDTTQPASQPE